MSGCTVIPVMKCIQMRICCFFSFTFYSFLCFGGECWRGERRDFDFNKHKEGDGFAVNNVDLYSPLLAVGRICWRSTPSFHLIHCLLFHALP